MSERLIIEHCSRKHSLHRSTNTTGTPVAGFWTLVPRRLLSLYRFLHGLLLP